MEVNRNDESAGGDSGADLGSERRKPDETGNQQQKPVAVRDKLEDTLLGLHARAFTGLKISQFLDGQTYVPDGCGNTQQKKNDGHPWPRSKFHIKVSTYPISDENGQGHLQAQTAIIG